MDHHAHARFSSSPGSSNGNASHQATPETKLTSLSPEESRGLVNGVQKAMQQVGGPPPFSLSNVRTSTTMSYGGIQPAFHGSAVEMPSLFHLGSPAIIRDPFASGLTRPRVNEHQKLSPTASAFMPSNVKNVNLSSVDQKPRLENIGKAPPKASYLNTTSTTDMNATDDMHLKQYLDSVIAKSAAALDSGPAQQPIGTRRSSVSDSSVEEVAEFSTDDDITRAVVIENIPRKVSRKELGELFNVVLFPSLKALLFDELPTNGKVYLGFTDIRDSENAYERAHQLHPEWSTRYFATSKFADKVQPGAGARVSQYEGQVIITVHFPGASSEFNPVTIHKLVSDLLANYGDVRVLEKMGTSQDPPVSYRVEYCDTKAAGSAVVALDGFKIGGCSLVIVHHEPDIVRASPRRPEQTAPTVAGRQASDLRDAMEQMTISRRDPGEDCNPEYGRPAPYAHLSPTGRSTLSREDYMGPPFARYGPGFGNARRGPSLYPGPFGPQLHDEFHRNEQPMHGWDLYGPGAIGQERGQFRQPYYGPNPSTPRRNLHRNSGRHDMGHHNIVDIERIRHGLDVRTTIMLRNIPNKIDQAMLKEIVDETSFGKYDFMYLRIDFANNCNVGYAFINFEDPWFIIDFVKARAGQRWNRFNSDKVAEVSYATIQGKDCLVQKFRNSSVMLEHPSFRPKIFHTGTGPLAGTEDTFPGPDNPSKMRRSVENAEHVGLFAPRAGQHFRDEQRRRRSQYDRGTRLAELEEAYELGVADSFEDSLRHRKSFQEGYYGRRFARNAPTY
ncbi:hypothetical protein L228DRAFT_269651 [Xylona heveae TC161]|uniref:RRM domain-containing protein n=1 Tax=Xylona heveae (strain CBS 132557 / TC161) TaxID=1328760 RepID=A0A165FQQ2_XYLHT|nr:hypothetical protein L228DRAFT_269651 [Xylona heveae TC161]KZF21263.1 hypothetical protein L228DRAFT_269651 [Xylona heveae TC161]